MVPGGRYGIVTVGVRAETLHGVTGCVAPSRHEPAGLPGTTASRSARHLVASDEEGDRVSRLDDDGLVTRVPSARWLANNVSADNVRWRGHRLGREMKDLGVNWNFAPAPTSR